MTVVDLGVTELAAAIADGAVTAEAAVRASLDRATRAAGLNAVVALEPELALEQARACDAERHAGRLRGPLHGVPLAHKDMFYRAGHPCQCGSTILADFVPEMTSPLIARLEGAGAITIGRLHMAEFAMGPTGHNAHLGRCVNPWHADAITGGSSSGSGAAVAAGIVPAALGSDTGGSVRLPAAFCGVVGLKPTNGLLPSDQMMPLSATMDTAGPLARSSRDLARLMSVLTGYREDYESQLGGLLLGVRIGVPTSYYVEEVDPAIMDALADARLTLSACGAEVVDVAIPDHAHYTELAGHISMSEAAAFHHDGLRDRPGDYGEQVRNRLLKGAATTAVDYLRALERRSAARAEMLEGPFAHCDILLTPATRMLVPSADAVNATSGAELDAMIGGLSALTRTVSMLGFPALVTPMGVDPRGLPIALQLIGPPLSEALLLRVGDSFEQATGWSDRRPSL